jgi:hypothetical protein
MIPPAAIHLKNQILFALLLAVSAPGPIPEIKGFQEAVASVSPEEPIRVQPDKGVIVVVENVE